MKSQVFYFSPIKKWELTYGWFEVERLSIRSVSGRTNQTEPGSTVYHLAGNDKFKGFLKINSNGSQNLPERKPPLKEAPKILLDHFFLKNA